MTSSEHFVCSSYALCPSGRCMVFDPTQTCSKSTIETLACFSTEGGNPENSGNWKLLSLAGCFFFFVPTKVFSVSFDFSFWVIWLPEGKLWATNEELYAPDNQLLRFFGLTRRSPESL